MDPALDPETEVAPVLAESPPAEEALMVAELAVEPEPEKPEPDPAEPEADPETEPDALTGVATA